MSAPPTRARSSNLVESTAVCRDCTKTITGRGARGAAARHHDATGHTIDVRHHEVVTYGEGVNPDQLAIPET